MPLHRLLADSLSNKKESNPGLRYSIQTTSSAPAHQYHRKGHSGDHKAFPLVSLLDREMSLRP
jgi:hypothetical protein